MEREREETRLIVRERRAAPRRVFDRNQFAWYKRRATLAMSYCEGWNRDPGKMAGEWSRDYRGFSALIPRFFYTPGGRSIRLSTDFWIRHAIPAAWNFIFHFLSFFLPSSFLSPLPSFPCSHRVCIELRSLVSFLRGWDYNYIGL